MNPVPITVVGFDWNAIIVALIMITPPTLVALLTLRATKAVGGNVETVHVAINSRMDELLKETKAAAVAAGIAAGRAQAGMPDPLAPNGGPGEKAPPKGKKP